MSDARATADDALYRVEAKRVFPTDLTQGPWDPDAQHGGPVAALLARTIERLDTPAPMRITRLTMELMRPVPLSPLTISSRVLRTGRKVQLAEGVICDDDVEVARVVGLSIRTDPGSVEFDPSLHSHDDDEAPDFDVGDEPTAPMGEPEMLGYLPGYLRAIRIERLHGMDGGGGVGEVWFRLRCRVVEGEEVTPLVRAAAVADFTSGMGNSLDFAKYTSINTDITMQMWRYPIGEWLALRAITKLEADGIGNSEAGLYDRTGRYGRGLTSLVLQRR